MVEDNSHNMVLVFLDDALAGTHQVVHRLRRLDLEYDLLVGFVDQSKLRAWALVDVRIINER